MEGKCLSMLQILIYNYLQWGGKHEAAAHLRIWSDWPAVDVFSSSTSVPSCPEASPGPAGPADWGLFQQNLHQPAPLLSHFEHCWLYCVASGRHSKNKVQHIFKKKKFPFKIFDYLDETSSNPITRKMTKSREGNLNIYIRSAIPSGVH